MKKHIVYVLGDYPIVEGQEIECGGIAVITRNIALGMINNGYNVTILAMVGSVLNNCTFNDNGINVQLFKNEDYNISSKIIEEKLHEINEIKKIDLVEITDSRPIISRYLPYPTCLRLHNSLPLSKFNSGIIKDESELVNINEKYYFYSLNLVDSIAGVSQSIIDQTVKFHKINPSTVYGKVYNGINTEYNFVSNNTKNSGQSISIFCHGTLGIMKGQKELCQVFKKLYDIDNNRFNLTLVGRNKNYFKTECLKELVESKENVKYYGNMSNKAVLDICSKLDIYISLSKTESFGMATVEAMSMGKPVIVSDISVYREIITDGKEGFLVNTDNIDEIVEKVLLLSNNSELYNEMSLNAYNKSKQYTLENTINNTIKWYENVLNNYDVLIKERNYAFEKLLLNTFFQNESVERAKSIRKNNNINRVLFLDKIHLSDRSFPKLHEYLKANKIDIDYLDANNSFILKAGDYLGNTNIVNELFLINSIYEEINENYLYKGYNIFELCYEELMLYMLKFKEFHNDLSENNNVFDIMKRKYTNILKAHLAVSVYWINYYEKNLNKITQTNKVILFSGSSTYQKVFFDFIKINKVETDVIVCENLFTGRDFYFEKRNTSIPNNSLIKYEQLNDNNSISKEHVLDKVRNQQNLNVKQPSRELKELFNNSNKTILILAQVINDYSLTNKERIYRSSINFYTELINKILLNTNYNVVVKTHPYESKKLNINKNLTKELLEDMFKNNERIKIVDNYNIYSLFDQATYIVTLCSQAALEATYYRKKVATLGSAFYGGKGFTYDYLYIDEYIEDLKNNRINEHLNMDEQNNYILFLTNLFQYHLVSDIDTHLLSKYLGSNIGVELIEDVNNINDTIVGKNKITLLQSQLAKKSKRVESLENSTSWKMTKVIRVIGDKIKRKK